MIAPESFWKPIGFGIEPTRGDQPFAWREQRRKVDGLAVKVRGTHVTVHADGSVTKKPSLSDGQLQLRADMGVLALGNGFGCFGLTK